VADEFQARPDHGPVHYPRGSTVRRKTWRNRARALMRVARFVVPGHAQQLVPVAAALLPRGFIASSGLWPHPAWEMRNRARVRDAGATSCY